MVSSSSLDLFLNYIILKELTRLSYFTDDVSELFTVKLISRIDH